MVLNPHTFAEVKSLINSKFYAILDELGVFIVYAMDTNNFSCYVIAMKGTKIAFFIYYNYGNLLTEYGIFNYNGFVPLNYIIHIKIYMEINYMYFNEGQGKHEFVIEYIKQLKQGVETDSQTLKKIGVESTTKVSHPHIWDLLNKNHEPYIHKTFEYMANNKPGQDIK